MDKYILVAPPGDPAAQMFMGAIFFSYLAKLVGLVEIIGGRSLLIKRAEFIGFLILLPVVVNIVVFHTAHDFIGNGIWLLPTVLYFSQKEKVRQVFSMSAGNYDKPIE